MKLIRYKNGNGDFEYKFVKSFTISCKKINKKIKYFITAQTDAGESQFYESFNSLQDAENELQLNFDITKIFTPIEKGED